MWGEPLGGKHAKMAGIARGLRFTLEGLHSWPKKQGH